MFKRFFDTARRNIARNKIYAFINFFGLSIGFALALLIFIFVREEISYEDYQEKAERIYRLNYSLPAQGMALATSPPPIAPKLPQYFSEVETATRAFSRNVSIRIGQSDDLFEESDIYFVDTTFTKIFTLKYLLGNPVDALKENTVIITGEMAGKYFGNQNPIGEVINFANKIDLTVVGVVEKFPANSHFRFNMLVAYEMMYDLESPQAAEIMKQNLSVNYIISHSFTYILLKEGADPKVLDEGMPQFLADNANENFQVGQVFTLMPIKDIHLNSTRLAEPSVPNSWGNILLFIAVSVLTVLIASINYINLSTAQSFSRVKEIGVRKVMGSDNYQLIIQFLTEAFIFVLISFLMAMVLLYFSIPLLNDLTGKEFWFWEEMDAPLLLTAGGLLFIITFLAGLYPGFFVTGFNAVEALKGKKLQSTGNGKILRKSLVTFQLMVASFLLIAAIIIIQQLNYIQNKALGFDKDQVLIIQLFSQNVNNIFSGTDSTYQSRLQTFTSELERQSFIASTTRISSEPGMDAMFRGTIPEGFTADDNLFNANIKTDYNFFKTFNIEIIAGRPLSREYPSDVTEGFVVNETAVRAYKWETPEKALGKSFNLEGKKGRVVGVMRDFHFMGLTQPLTPLSVDISNAGSSLLAIKIDGSNTRDAINFIEAKWAEMFPEKTFEFAFLDDDLATQYISYNNFGKIIKYFTIIAMIISGLGLYGMILYSAKSKQKEIGIKKVLGANVPTILSSIYKEFLILILIAFIFAIPLSYLAASDWLNVFEYRVDISVRTYIIGLSAILILVLITISYTAIKAALVNPVNSIRNE